MVKHEFTQKIIDQLTKDTGIDGNDLLSVSHLLEYINIKTKSANRGSKSRSNFGNLYAIYVLIEDYVNVVFKKNLDYSKHDGAVFLELLDRQRKLPFGTKLQNHALNHRLNQEFHKYFPASEDQIILRDVATSRYWINKNLLNIRINGKTFDISKSILSIIDLYIEAKSYAFDNFIKTCEKFQKIDSGDSEIVISFISNLLEPNVDARLFEIVSFSILKYYYHDIKIFWGYTKDNLIEENLKLYKTGRTNANDGGIDFVMKPLGYFFQVTETLDVKKYFLDIDKLEHYPIRFVIKTIEDKDVIMKKLRNGAVQQYGIDKIVERYMASIEEIVTIPMLKSYFTEAVKMNYINDSTENTQFSKTLEIILPLW